MISQNKLYLLNNGRGYHIVHCEEIPELVVQIKLDFLCFLVIRFSYETQSQTGAEVLESKSIIVYH